VQDPVGAWRSRPTCRARTSGSSHPFGRPGHSACACSISSWNQTCRGPLPSSRNRCPSLITGDVCSSVLRSPSRVEVLLDRRRYWPLPEEAAVRPLIRAFALRKILHRSADRLAEQASNKTVVRGDRWAARRRSIRDPPPRESSAVIPTNVALPTQVLQGVRENFCTFAGAVGVGEISRSRPPPPRQGGNSTRSAVAASTLPVRQFGSGVQLTADEPLVERRVESSRQPCPRAARTSAKRLPPC